MRKETSTYLLRLPASLKAAAAEISREDGTSINQFITTAVAEKVAAMKTAEFLTAHGGEADIERPCPPFGSAGIGRYSRSRRSHGCFRRHRQ